CVVRLGQYAADRRRVAHADVADHAERVRQRRQRVTYERARLDGPVGDQRPDRKHVAVAPDLAEAGQATNAHQRGRADQPLAQQDRQRCRDSQDLRVIAVLVEQRDGLVGGSWLKEADRLWHRALTLPARVATIRRPGGRLYTVAF